MHGYPNGYPPMGFSGSSLKGNGNVELGAPVVAHGEGVGMSSTGATSLPRLDRASALPLRAATRECGLPALVDDASTD
jgi:hypothetical protein